MEYTRRTSSQGPLASFLFLQFVKGDIQIYYESYVDKKYVSITCDVDYVIMSVWKIQNCELYHRPGARLTKI